MHPPYVVNATGSSTTNNDGMKTQRILKQKFFVYVATKILICSLDVRMYMQDALSLK